MIDKSKYGIKAKLISPASAMDTTLVVGSARAEEMRPADGTHYFLTLRNNVGFVEVVEVVGVSSDSLVVKRGMDDTKPQQWGTGTCLSFEWSPSQICEMIAACSGGATKKGCYKIGCDSILELRSDGTIANIKGAEVSCS